MEKKDDLMNRGKKRKTVCLTQAFTLASRDQKRGEFEKKKSGLGERGKRQRRGRIDEDR